MHLSAQDLERKCGRMARIEKKTKRYPTDLTDEEWERIVPFLPKPARQGRKPGVDMREVLNAISYIARAGCGWRMLPKDFPPWQTVYWWFRRFMRRFLFVTIQDVALMIDRERAGREASSTRRCGRQPIGESAGCQGPRLRRRQEDPRTQAPHCGRHGWTASHRQPDDGGHRQFGRSADDPRRPSAALAPGSNTCSSRQASTT